MRTLKNLAYDKVVAPLCDGEQDAVERSFVCRHVPAHLAQPDAAFLDHLPTLSLRDAFRHVAWVTRYEASPKIASEIFCSKYPPKLFIAEIDAALFLSHHKVCMQYCDRLLPISREDTANELMRDANKALSDRKPEALSLKNLLDALQQTFRAIDVQFPRNNETFGVLLAVDALFRRAQLPYLYYLALRNTGLNYGALCFAREANCGAALTYLDGDLAAINWY